MHANVCIRAMHVHEECVAINFERVGVTQVAGDASAMKMTPQKRFSIGVSEFLFYSRKKDGRALSDDDAPEANLKGVS
jgi:hypothetical protein